MTERTDLDYLMLYRSTTPERGSELHGDGVTPNSLWIRAGQAARTGLYQFFNRAIAWLGAKLVAWGQGLQGCHISETAKAEH